MFTRKPASTDGLEAMRREAIRVANDHTDLKSDEYQNALQTVERLSVLIVKEKREPLSWNTVLPVVGTIASVLVITDFERLNVVTTKALQFLPKLLK